MFLNSRQKEILRAFISGDKPISYKRLSDHFKLSTRTIQREVKSLGSILKRYHIKISKKTGSDLQLLGSDADIKRLKHQLQDAQVMTTYSPDEREEGMTYDLLLTNEPLKMNYFSAKYGVSGATVAYDLDKVTSVFEASGIEVERIPGIGVYHNGTEQQRRALLSRLLHKDITFEDWLEIFQKKASDYNSYGKLGSIIRNRLLKFVQTDKITDVDRVVNGVLNEQSDVTLTDRNYVNLIIHIVLSMERIESGQVIEYETPDQWDSIESDTFPLAERIVKRLERVFVLTFPKIEISYISLHLAGAKISAQIMDTDDNCRGEFIWIEVVQSFIHAIEKELKLSFEGDKLLFDGLVSHLVPVFNRLRYHLQIHNPMLEKIKENYSDVFVACENASDVLEERMGYPIPEDEVGYLTMHIGASMLRNDAYTKQQYKAVVVCASGLGTSMYLATKIRSEITNLNVEDVISMNKLANWLEDDHDVDIIVSTVHLSIKSDIDVVMVSPFLTKEDQTKIKNTLASAIHTKKRDVMVTEVNHEASHSLLSLATFGEGLIQILRYFRLYEDVMVERDRISSLLAHVQGVTVVSDLDKLIADVQERERQGGFILDGLAMLHTKSNGVMAPLVVLFRTAKPVPWYNDKGEEQTVKVVMLLVVPDDAPEEHMKIMSEIPASFVEETFFKGMVNGTEIDVRCLLEEVLTNAFRRRISSEEKGLSET